MPQLKTAFLKGFLRKVHRKLSEWPILEPPTGSKAAAAKTAA